MVGVRREHVNYDTVFYHVSLCSCSIYVNTHMYMEKEGIYGNKAKCNKLGDSYLIFLGVSVYPTYLVKLTSFHF